MVFLTFGLFLNSLAFLHTGEEWICADPLEFKCHILLLARGGERETIGHRFTKYPGVPGMVLGAEAMDMCKRWWLSLPSSHSTGKT